jgi:hypothetical protein
MTRGHDVAVEERVRVRDVDKPQRQVERGRPPLGRRHVPERGALARPDGSPWFEFVEQVEAGERWYRVVAYNEAGAGPASSVVSGSPP